MTKIASLADIEAFEAVPHTARWRGETTYDVIANSASQYPDRPAFKFQNTSDVDEEPTVVTYADLMPQIHQTANA
ncbi:MAG: acyl-CoA synthetase, partial [Pseudomonadota bacterium]